MRERTENRDNRNKMREREASLHKVNNSERPKVEDLRTKTITQSSREIEAGKVGGRESRVGKLKHYVCMCMYVCERSRETDLRDKRKAV